MGTSTTGDDGSSTPADGGGVGGGRNNKNDAGNNGNDDDVDDGSDSEESALIVWDDKASGASDLRHLLTNNNNNERRERVVGPSGDDDDGGGRRGITRRSGVGQLPLAMTQQIEGLSFDDVDDSDVDDDDIDIHNDIVCVDELGTIDRGSSHMTKEGTNTMTPPPPHPSSSLSSSVDDGVVNKRDIIMNTNTNNNNRNNRRLIDDSGDVPATISKLRRGRSGRQHQQQRHQKELDGGHIIEVGSKGCVNNVIMSLKDNNNRTNKKRRSSDDNIENIYKLSSSPLEGGSGVDGSCSNIPTNNNNSDSFSEIELGLDRACSSSSSSSSSAVIATTFTTKNAIQTTTDNTNSEADVDTMKAKYIATAVATNTAVTDNVNDDDEEWNDDDLAAIDLLSIVAQQQRQNQQQHQRPIVTTYNINKEGNDYDDDEFHTNDDDLAAIDLSAAVYTQQQQRSLNNIESTMSTPPEGQHSNITAAAAAAAPETMHGEFDEDDTLFAEMDFDALDNTILKQQQRQKKMISYLKFTRYIVQTIQEDVIMHTKTIGVTLWKGNANNFDDDEIVCLTKICIMQDNKANSCNSSSNHEEINSIDGYMHLRGEWYYSTCHVGDIVHLCSLSGNYNTDVSALPVTLDSHQSNEDDLVLVLHPDELVSPSIVSDAVQCPRLAVLKTRLGSTGLSSKSAVIGILRHELFQQCLTTRDASHKSAALFTRQIIRDKSEALIGCGLVDRSEAFGEVIKTLSQIQLFLSTYTSWKDITKPQKENQFPQQNDALTNVALLKGTFASYNTLIDIRGVYSTEENACVPELGLTGNVDATVVARTKPPPASMSSATGTIGPIDTDSMKESLFPVELKTGHSQNPAHNHLAQLTLYTIMLRARHGTCDANSLKDNVCDVECIGSASSGMLLYLNHESHSATHVKPTMSDIKTLIGTRNSVVCNVIRSSRPRGIVITYEEVDSSDLTATTCNGVRTGRSRVAIEEPSPPSALPMLQPSISSCERCFKNRECMMYAFSDSVLHGSNNSGHGRLLSHFTGHLDQADLEYFRKWDRLIDLERHASARDAVSKSWLFKSSEKEMRDGKCISSLVLDDVSLFASGLSVQMFDINDNCGNGEEDASIRFFRASDSKLITPLSALNFDVGSTVIVSENGTSFVSTIYDKEVRHRMYILTGIVTRIGDRDIHISVPKKDVVRLKRLVKNGDGVSSIRKFRLDRDEHGGSFGLLYQNLVNFFTLDIPPFSAESLGKSPAKTKSLAMNTMYSDRRRRLNSSIVRLVPPPRFRNISTDSLFAGDTFTLDVPGCDPTSLRRDFGELNSDQKGAVLKAVSAEDFTLIQGLPGTGKSATIAFLTRLLVSKGKRVLLTSYTHSAVDNLLCKLINTGMVSVENMFSPVVRIGRESSCHVKVVSILAQTIASKAEGYSSGLSSRSIIEAANVDYLHKAISEAKVVGVTALTAPRSPLLAGQHFDVVIVDEAGQICQPAVLGAIMAADMFILVGDHMQLPPLVKSEVANEGGYGISMLMRLAEGFPDAVAKLTMQYRMNEDICQLSNIIAYKGLLKCGNDFVRHQKLDQSLSNKFSMIDPIYKPWMECAINPNQPVVFLDTDDNGYLEDNGVRVGAGGPINEFEASVVQGVILSLLICGLDNASIGVITPFRSQLRLFNDNPALHESRSKGLEICTIDKFQGRDKSVIIISLVRSNNEGNVGRLLQDFRRLNVAFSRAKHKMIIVGSFNTMQRGSDVLRPVLESLMQRNWVHKVPK